MTIEANANEPNPEIEDDLPEVIDGHDDGDWEYDDDVTFVAGGEVVDFDEDEPEDEESEGDAESETASDDADTTATEGDSTPTGTDEGTADEAATDAPDPAAATEAPTVDASTTAEPEPLRFKADGKEFTVAGRRDDAGNYVIAAEEWNRVVQPRLADRGQWSQERLAYQRQIAALDPMKNPEVVRARKLTEQFQALLDQGPEAVIEWAEKYDANKEALLARAEAAAARAEADAARGVLTEQERAAQVRELEGQLSTAVDTLLTKAQEVEDYRDLDMTYVRELLTPVMSSIFFRAPRDMPEYGIKQGEIGVNVEVVDRILRTEANRVAKQREREAATSAASAAAQRNAAVLEAAAPAARARKAPPPVTTGKATPGQGAKEPQERPKTMEEWEAKLSALAAGRA